MSRSCFSPVANGHVALLPDCGKKLAPDHKQSMPDESARDGLTMPEQSLDEGASAFSGSRFGHDFTRVRVHNPPQDEPVSIRSMPSQGVLQRKSVGQAQAVSVPPLVHEVLRSPGRPLNPSTRAFFEPRVGKALSQSAPLPLATGKWAVSQPGDVHEREADRVGESVVASPGSRSQLPGPRFDLGSIRIHSDPQAGESARAVNALAYTVGRDIVFGQGQYAPHSIQGQQLIAHELAHVFQQSRGVEGIMRAPLPDETQPRTFIIVYGSGQVNPTTYQHDVGGMFKIVAKQKLNEIKARLGKKAAQHNFVFEYTPTEAELKRVLNQKYAAPVAELHVFSHGWDEGANLGGPVAPKKKATETAEDAQQRRLIESDLSEYHIEFAKDAIAVFYGCNIGNVDAEARPFAQQFSDAFGVTVSASTRSTHFENKGGWHQVPDTGGKVMDFTPSPATARAELARYKALLVKLKAFSAPVKKSGLLYLMWRDQTREDLRARIAERRPVVHRLIQFLPESERTKALAELSTAEASVK